MLLQRHIAELGVRRCVPHMLRADFYHSVPRPCVLVQNLCHREFGIS